MIKQLDQVSKKDLSLVGGKAASLGEMIVAGIPVPGGFVLTTDAYRSGMTEELSSSILAHFDRLGAERVAVRSSAVAEDSDDASWAGQLESYLNVRKDDLLEAIEDCWKSINSKHAQKYADSHNVADADRAVAVVVQAMVESEMSGVLFTANPVTGDTDQMMIESVLGLGELQVQGAVTPESIIATSEGAIIERHASAQHKKLAYQNGANVELTIDATEVVVADDQVKELIGIATSIVAHYKAPQDIEWAYKGGAFFIVQSRPITTL